MPLPRPCRKCEKRFQPKTRNTKLCYDCYKKAISWRNKDQ